MVLVIVVRLCCVFMVVVWLVLLWVVGGWFGLCGFVLG